MLFMVFLMLSINLTSVKIFCYFSSIKSHRLENIFYGPAVMFVNMAFTKIFAVGWEAAGSGR